MIKYSVIIRTTGMAGEKYKKLLDSIAALIPNPMEVIVVLPIGFREPKEQLGYEKFYYAPKGMVSQRLYGIEQCKTEYALICDDDVCFNSNFVEMLHDPISAGICDISAGPLLSFLPQKGINSLVDMVLGAACPTILHKNTYCTILRTSGYSYNRKIDTKKHKFLETESLPWTCFYAKVDALKKIHLEEETWLDSHGYAALDDQTMFYKAKLLGIRTVVVTDAIYQHLDAKTSTTNNKEDALYSGSFNRIVFWHRFILSKQDSFMKRLYTRLCFKYRMICACLFALQSVIRHRMTMEGFRISREGYKDGWMYIKSKEYLDLPFIDLKITEKNE